MKRYEFHSALPPEEIYTRLEICTGKGLYYGRHKKGFALHYIGACRGVIPFWVEVREEEGGSLISGRFPVWRAAWQTVAIFFGFTVLMTPLFGIPFRMYPMVIAVLLLAVPIYAGFGKLVNIVFGRKQREIILEFIQQHLLE